MPSDLWDDWFPAAYVPDASIAFFGANPCHSPAAESQPTDRCERCGGAYVAPNGRVFPNAGLADPIRPYEAHVGEFGDMRADELVVVCGACGRSYYDATRAMSRAFMPPLEDTASVAIESDDPVTEDGQPLAASPNGTVLYDPRQEHRDHMPRGRLKGGLGDRPPRRQDKKRKVKRY